MSDESRDDQPTQYTPEGYEIPVPSREDVELALRKMARPARPEPLVESEPKPSRRLRRRRPKE